MKKEKIRNYDVSFSGLKLGQHQFQYKLNQTFFDLFEFEQDFESPQLNVDITLIKATTLLEFYVKLDGTVKVACDLTAEKFNLDLNQEAKLVVKFGEDYDYTDDEIWVIPFGEHSVNIAQFLYEISVLSIPSKRIHPNVENGTSESNMLKLLNQLEPKIVKEDEEARGIDPRWEALKKLNNN